MLTYSFVGDLRLHNFFWAQSLFYIFNFNYFHTFIWKLINGFSSEILHNALTVDF